MDKLFTFLSAIFQRGSQELKLRIQKIVIELQNFHLFNGETLVA